MHPGLRKKIIKKRAAEARFFMEQNAPQARFFD